MYLTNVVKSSWRLGIYYFYAFTLFTRGGTLLLSVRERRANCIGNLEVEVPFYWQLERVGAILLSEFERRVAEFFYYICNLQCWLLAGASFYGPCSSLTADIV